jgi:protein O-GlcNAc transferase
LVAIEAKEYVMGLFGYFWSAGNPSYESGSRAETPEQGAARLIAEGNAIEDQGRLDEAMQRYEDAIRLAPALARAHLNRGNILLATDRPEEAIDAFSRALSLDPGYAAAHYNIGNTNARMGKYEAALAAYREAIRLNPEFADAELAQGYVQDDLGQFENAAASFQRALAIRPDYAEAYSNLGTALRNLGRYDEAAANFRRALQIAPDSAITHCNLGITLKDIGQLDGALASCRRALEIDSDLLDALDTLLFTRNYLVDQSAAVMRTDAKHYGEVVAQKARPYTTWHNTPEPERCLRVGLVSGDLYGHPVGYFVESVLAALKVHVPGRLKFFAYASYFRFDEVSERIRTSCEDWHSAVGLSDERLARRIWEDSIDILIDLSGHTGYNRLPVFAWKPAPVQVTWLGYLATTGVKAVDYLIADGWTLPETEEGNFTETIWRMPESYLCFTPPDADIAVSPLPALANGYVTFGCFNNLTKVNDAVIALWARVLLAVPGSRLLLKARQLAEESIRRSVAERFGVHGVSADRLILAQVVHRRDYLAPYQQVDIALDPFPYPGITTSVEGLWMGVPLLTLAGDTFLSRQGIGLLMNSGLPEWIASDADDYVNKAIAHAGNLQALAALRKELRQRVLASPIFDASRFARHFEAALRGMWQQWCDSRQV